MEELIADVKADETNRKDVPQFMYDFVQEWVDDSWRQKAAFAEDRLWSLFYEYAMSSSNAFVRKWYEFNLDMNNIINAITARKYNLDMQKVIVGQNDTAHALRTHRTGSTGGPRQMQPYRASFHQPTPVQNHT